MFVLVAAILVAVGANAGARAPRLEAPSPQRTVAREWVHFVDDGDQRDACALQTLGEVNGQPCSALPAGVALHCPKNAFLHGPRRGGVRPPSQQVGMIVEESSSLAFARLHSQRRRSRVGGALGMELHEGVWRVSYLRQAQRIFAPAGTMWYSGVWRSLWYPYSCAFS
ncbi:MAG TPA: hypothetical protein VMH33_02025 [Solirubrobacterales bacterium]|nr:hypothetical protein [Solirubrobacterales bacterium]